MGNRYRIPKNGRLVFSSFKDYIKFHGLDVVAYDSLNTKEKRIWNGVHQSEKQFKNKKGQIISKLKIDQFKKVYKVKEIAEQKNVDADEYLRGIWDGILKAAEGKMDYLPSKNFDTIIKLLKDNKESNIYINGKKYKSNTAALLFAKLKNKISECNIGQNLILDSISVSDFFGNIYIDSDGLKQLQTLIRKFDKNKDYDPTDEELDIEGLIGSSDPKGDKAKKKKQPEKRANKKHSGFRKH